MRIDYSKLVEEATDNKGVLIIEELILILKEEWIDGYYDTSSHDPNLCEFDYMGFTYLFDHATEYSKDTEVEDRVVAAYGWSSGAKRKRDKKRQREFLGGALNIPRKGIFDKGHLIAYSIGGGMDVNLFPQRSELNQGISSAGRIYRKMEVYAETHPGTFTFSRLIYNDDSWVPSALEYGVLKQDGTLWAEWFEN